MESLHALMRDIGALRRRLETDLTLTAAALEQDELAFADQVLGDSLAELKAFDAQAQVHLGGAPPWPDPVVYVLPRGRAIRRLREAAVAASVAAAAVLLLASPASQGGVTYSADAPPADLVVDEARITAADETLTQTMVELTTLSQAQARPKASLRAVADSLAVQVGVISLAAEPDPKAAGKALGALRQEHRLLTASNDDGSLDDVIERNRTLTDTLLDLVTEVLVAPPTPTATPSPGPLTGLLGTLLPPPP